MKLFLSYIKSRLLSLLLIAVFCSVFILVFILYGMPAVLAVYPSLICLAICLVVCVIDYLNFRKYHITLKKLVDETDNMILEFPYTNDLIQSDYQDIILYLSETITNIRNQKEADLHDTIDYYTVWAHQIKTPISSMKLSLQSEDTPISRKLSFELFRIEQYVEMVLTYLRLNSEYSDYIFREYRIDDIVRAEVRKFASEFISRKLKFEYIPSEKTVITDEKWLSFVIGQILSNALKYTSQGGIKIYTCDPNILCISDTGIGIAENDLPRIFDKGYTGYNRDHDRSSSGLGLYLCRKVCDNLGVKISVRSHVSQGTKVELDLSQYKIKAE